MTGGAPVPPAPAPSTEYSAADAASVGFVLRLGRALHIYGSSADALEQALQAMSERLGLEANFFTTPTSIFAAFGPPERQHTHLIRVYPGDVDLGKLARLDAVSRDVEQGRLSVVEGSVRIEAIMALPPISRPIVRVLAYGLASAAVCRILGGGLNELVVAGFAGLLTGVISLASRRLPHGTHVFELVAAFAVSLVVTCFAAISDLRLSVPTATLGGVIALVPGLTVTVAMTELARRHLAAGTARLSGAFLVFIAIAFGVAVGGEVAQIIVGDVRSMQPRRLPEWTLTLALGLAPLAFGVLLRARLRDFPWLWLSSTIGYTAVRRRRTVVRPGAGGVGGGTRRGGAGQPVRQARVRAGRGRPGARRAAPGARQHRLPLPGQPARPERGGRRDRRLHDDPDRGGHRCGAARLQRSGTAATVGEQFRVQSSE